MHLIMSEIDTDINIDRPADRYIVAPPKDVRWLDTTDTLMIYNDSSYIQNKERDYRALYLICGIVVLITLILLFCMYLERVM